jgi:hypothetical protein
MKSRSIEPPSTLSEPDSDEQLRYLVQSIADALDPIDLDADLSAAMIVMLKAFALRVREHERVAIRERPTQPDMGKVLPDV